MKTKKVKTQQSYLVGAATRSELENLSACSEVSFLADRALRSTNQLGVISANHELEVVLRLVPAVAEELDAALAQALADEVAGKSSYRFPE